VELDPEVAMMRPILLLAITSCASTSDPMAVRFANAPAATKVYDRKDTPVKPDVILPLNEVDFYDRSFTGPIVRGLSLPEPGRALGVNALDEVPDSTWFTNRIGVRDLTPAEITKGPVDDDGPEGHKPWTVLSTKPGGTELGFVIKDARGVKYLLSFDDSKFPETETGADVVVNRLLWAVGYHVPQDSVAYIHETDLVLGPDAKVKDHLGHEIRELDQQELTDTLQHAWHAPDGSIRVVASKYLPGEPLGGTPPSGIRDDDPNDVIVHERRRDRRGAYPIFAWVDHIDLVQSNFLDMWTADAADPSHHYVVHYLVDFGKSLGTMSLTDNFVRAGHAYSFDWADMAKSLISLGWWPRLWGHYWAPPVPGVAPTFTVEAFHPDGWKPDVPFAAFDDGDRFDNFWGAKLMARLTRADIRAAVEAGRFSDPRAIDYLTETLVARQQATLRYWFARVNPLDRFAVTAHALCFEDLAIAAQLAPAAGTHYELASYDDAGGAIGTVTIAAAPAGPTCTHDVIMSTAATGYTIVKITTQRPDYAGSTLVHLARGAAGQWQVIGVWRL
jgi:hypothetical protein